MSSGPYRSPAGNGLTALVDPGTFEPLAVLARARRVTFPIPRPYGEVLDAAEAATGATEAVTVGIARLGGHGVAVAAFDFAFLGGTLGVATGTRLVDLFARATREGLPVVLRTASGGVRVQEGVAALAQMPRVATAAAAHRAAGLLQVTILGDPTYGGVGAGFALAADVLVVEPGARIGFLGARVAPDPAAGSVVPVLADAVLDGAEQRAWVIALLDVLGGAPRPRQAPGAPRPGLAGRLARATDGCLELAGDRRGVASHGLATGFAVLDGRPFGWVVLADGTDGSRPDVAAYATARRHLALSARLGLPVVSLIDTAGADPSPAAGIANIAGEIAQVTAEFATASTATLAVVTGHGGSGGAMSLAGADRVVLDPAGRFEVLPPRAVATIVTGDGDAAPSVVPWMGGEPPALLAAGLVDEIVDVSEPTGLRTVIGSFLADPPPAGARLRRWEQTGC